MEGQLGDTWYLDELFTKTKGVKVYLLRTVDQDGDTLDVLIQQKRDKCAAKEFFSKLLKGLGITRVVKEPIRIEISMSYQR